MAIFFFYFSFTQTELITSSGYPVEVYTVKTDDGFLLDLHRIPHGRNRSKKAAHGKGGNDQPKGVVFLQHALLSSACDWVMNFPNDSLGEITMQEKWSKVKNLLF